MAEFIGLWLGELLCKFYFAMWVDDVMVSDIGCESGNPDSNSIAVDHVW